MRQIVMAIDLGSINATCAIAEVVDGVPKILGYGQCQSRGIKKGAISNIEQAARSVQEAVDCARRMSGTTANKAIVSISGVYTKSRNGSGIVTIPNGEIGTAEIKRVVVGALHNVQIPIDYDVIHVLPYQFVVDEQEQVDDPNGMSGGRLKAMVHIVTAQKTHLENLKRVMKTAGIEIENIVLSSYASALATLSDDERELGVACVDIGGSTCDVMIYSGNSMCHNEVIKVGSHHITSDISMAFNTPLSAAEKIKIEHSDLANYQEQSNSKRLEIPLVGGSNKTQQIAYGDLAKVACYRLLEIFGIVYDTLKKNELRGQINAGLVLTGGMMKLKGIDKLVEAFSKELPTRIALPREIEGMPQDFCDYMNATLVGLILYSSGNFTKYELDSHKRLRVQKSRFIEDDRFDKVDMMALNAEQQELTPSQIFEDEKRTQMSPDQQPKENKLESFWEAFKKYF
ncbi:cell division protein FtsA [Helicobacter enhydrae]|uniref:Cell division protein FtsA n=1 Tax=Helicobacter enhydrae TaxID=222136 RepID=A0A1B1U6W3_9HELI|nr:cell division protein FtsA [Helicobacter enhydrae]ANV98425.1 cell division protein FtsA [Helicobacter enhydrae]